MVAKEFIGRKGEDELNNAIKERSDYTYCVFEDILFESDFPLQSDFDSSIFNKCIFNMSSFQRSDLEGVSFRNCKFSNCDFSHSDIRSCIMESCVFNECKFTNSEFHRNDIINSDIFYSDFSHSTFTENHIIGCNISNSPFSRASLHHLIFEKCSFHDQDIFDCSSLYFVFDDCIFLNFGINIEAIGTSVGIPLKDLDNFKLYWKSQPISIPDGLSILESLLITYDEKGWNFSKEVTKFNFLSSGNLERHFSLITSVIQSNERSSLIRDDEIRFVIMILRHLHEKKRVPLGAIAGAKNLIESISDDGSRRMHSVRLLANEIRNIMWDMEQNYIDYYKKNLQKIIGKIGTISIKFDVIPTYDVIYVAKFFSENSYNSENEIEFKQSRQGSWYIDLYGSAMSLSAILLNLYLIQGILYRIIVIRGQTEVVFSKNLPSNVKSVAVSPPVGMPKEAKEMMRSCVQKINSHKSEYNEIDRIISDDKSEINDFTFIFDD